MASGYQTTVITHPGGAPPAYRAQDESDTRRAGPQVGHLENRDTYKRKHSKEHRNYRDVEGPSKHAMLCGFADEVIKLSAKKRAVKDGVRYLSDLVRWLRDKEKDKK